MEYALCKISEHFWIKNDGNFNLISFARFVKKLTKVEHIFACALELVEIFCLKGYLTVKKH